MSDEQICNGFCIDFDKKLILQAASVAPDRFAMDSVSILMRK